MIYITRYVVEPPHDTAPIAPLQARRDAWGFATRVAELMEAKGYKVIVETEW